MASTGARSHKLGLALPAAVFLVLVFVFPLGLILTRSVTDPHFGPQNYLTFFRESVYITVLLNTFRLGLIVTVVSLLLGYPVAYLMTVASPRVSRWMMVVITLSFWTSLLVRTYAWMVLLQNNGLINRALLWFGLISQPVQLVHNTTGVVIGMTYVMLPFMILPIRATMLGIDPGLMRAATSLGAPPWGAFVRVFAPLTLPGVGAGCLMVFVMSLGYYVTPALLGGTESTMMAQLVAQQVQSFLNWGLGTAAATVLLIITLLIFSLYSKTVGWDNPWDVK